MAQPAIELLDDDAVTLRRTGVRFPIELRPTGAVGRLRQAPPVLAAEVAGQDEDEGVLRAKAAWYLQHGVTVVWLVLPEAREVLVIRSGGESRHGSTEGLPPESALPGLTPRVAQLFAQLDAP